MISNASDAIEKLSTVKEAGEEGGEYPAGQITVAMDTEKNRIIISDNGIGMTKKRSIGTSIRLPSPGRPILSTNTVKIKKIQLSAISALGFYSAFMLADHVAIETKSYQENATAVRWDCNSDMSYEMTKGDKAEHGTDIILYLNENNPYAGKAQAVHDIIKKYFQFLKTEIYFDAPGFDHVLVNDADPIWKQPDSKIDPEAMKQFYREFYDDISNPLFWIKFESADIGVRGILFFRDTKNKTEELDGTFKIYNRGGLRRRKYKRTGSQICEPSERYYRLYKSSAGRIPFHDKRGRAKG